MTQAKTHPSTDRLSQTSPTLFYQVSMSEPESHLFEVMLRVKTWDASVLDLKMPVWTPGSYLVREYAKNLQDFSACDLHENALNWRKRSKNHWQIDTAKTSEIVVRYRVFAHELSVRTNHLDRTHGYFNGAALFFYIPGWERTPVHIKIVPPKPEWRVTTALPPTETPNTFRAEDFDTLVDSPFEIGTQQSYHFQVEGLPHELAIWGEGNLNVERAIADIEKIIQVESKLFGGLPYDRYLFLLHLSAQGYGGLEHKNSCSLNYPRFGLRSPDRYNRFMQLVAHEFFHLWNVRRIRPKALEQFDYESENYTEALWFCEGTTSYYDTVIPLRAKIYDAKTFLQNLSKDITRLQTIPGRRVQPLSESSWDAWIKLYRRDSNSDNAQISYYLKGELVSLLLDLLIRSRHDNQRSLDNVMQQMWEQFGKAEIGFTDAQLKSVIESVAATDLTDFFDRYLHGTEELPFDEYLAPFGLQLKANGNGNDSAPYLGLSAQPDNGKAIVKFVEIGSPAQRAGIDPDDELLAIGGFRVTAETLEERLKDYQPGDRVEVSLFHQEELRTYPVTLAEPRPKSYQLVSVSNPTVEQEKLFKGWLETTLDRL
ncbi:M61 family metallopeptidase [Oxynema sp. CENA135]|uniref:M61 family metallopeptidase n=1 Tax=Oxynema sp. CENA135 TaxID=984206 RepID=UPI0019093130|nr:M61 family metallopeptidase [Oxynema sp. CENA135]MBK4732056.1 M61 family metallopeptidase [Oxynema sp. CENA135]